MKRALYAAAVLMAAAAAQSGATPPRTHVIVIDQMKFGALPTDLRAGDRITWVNRDMFQHTATARDGSFSADLRPGTQITILLRHPGKIAFFCKYHPGMTGVLEVAN